MIETRSGGRVIPGDVLDMAVGQALVLKAQDVHGGRECLVCAPGGGSSRWLWFWPNQSVRVLRRDTLTLKRRLEERAERASKLSAARGEGERKP